MTLAERIRKDLEGTSDEILTVEIPVIAALYLPPSMLRGLVLGLAVQKYGQTLSREEASQALLLPQTHPKLWRYNVLVDGRGRTRSNLFRVVHMTRDTLLGADPAEAVRLARWVFRNWWPQRGTTRRLAKAIPQNGGEKNDGGPARR